MVSHEHWTSGGKPDQGSYLSPVTENEHEQAISKTYPIMSWVVSHLSS